MKGSVSLNPKFNSLNIKPTRILMTTPLVACDERHLYFKASQKESVVKSIRWEDKSIVNCTYVKKYGVILLLCENYRVYAMTQNLEEISCMTGWQSKYTLAFDYIEQYSILLMISSESVEMMKVAIDTNIKKTKFLSSIKFTLKKISLQPTILTSSLPWNKGYGINVNQSLLYVFSPESVAFFSLSSQQLLSDTSSLVKKQHPITCCYFSSYFKYTVLGTSGGEIKVWRVPLYKKFNHENVLIHTFQTHVKSIKQMVESKYSQKIFLASGQDLLVTVWSLETFESLRKFQFFGIYSQINVGNIDQAIVLKDGILGELNFGQSLQFITEVNSNVLLVDRQQFLNSQNNHLLPNSSSSLMGTITLTLQENIGLIFDSSLLLNTKELNKMEMKFIYPPLKAKSIKQILSSPFVASTYFLLAENGQIFRVLVPPFGKEYIGVSSKIEQSYNIEFSQDKQKHPLNQLPSVICFLDLLPTEFDSQIREIEDAPTKTYYSRVQQKNFTLKQAIKKYENLKLLAVGCQKGTVVFLSCNDMTKIYCRLSYHRQRIISIQCVKQYKQTDFNPMIGMAVTFCSQNYLKMIKFDYEKSVANCILTYYAGEQLKMLRGFQNFLAIVFYKGEFEITEIDLKGKSEQFCCRRPSIPQNHQGQILSIDYQRKNQLVLTAATDNKIKLWTTKKILLFDIHLDDGLGYCFFVPHAVNKFNQAADKQNQINQGQALSNQHNINKNVGDENRNKDDQSQKRKQKEQQKKPILTPLELKLQQLRSRPKPLPVNFDMVILHGQKILYFHHIPLSFRPQQIQSFNNNPQNVDNYKISLREVFESYIQKNVYQGDSPKIDKKSSKQQDNEKQHTQNYPKRQRINTQPTQQYYNRNFQSEQKQQTSISPVIIKNKFNKFKTQASIPYEANKFNQFESQILGKLKKKQKKQKKLTNVFGEPSRSVIKEFLYKPGLISQSSIDATKRHIHELQCLRQQVNKNNPFLPKIQGKKEDIFDQFMRQKLVKKSVLTRRDITINRIIMKNIIKEHFADETRMTGLKLQY